MGEEKKDATIKRTTPEMRKASLLLSGLVLTPDSALDAFRKRRAADPDLDEAHLRRARDLLDAVAEALTSTDVAKWQAIERAWNAVVGNAVVGNAEVGTPAPPSRASTPEPTPSESGPAPPPPVGTPLREDQIPPGVAPQTTGSSPWAKATPMSPVGSPPAAPSSIPSSPAPPISTPPIPTPVPSAAPPVAAPASAPPSPAINIDVDTLNKIKLDGEEASTLPSDAVFAADNTVLPFQGKVKPPPSKIEHQARDPLGETRTAFHEIDIANPTPFEQTDGPTSQQDFAPTERLDVMQVAQELSAMDSPPASVPAAELPAHLSHMTLEQYAALCAECAVSPQWTQQIHARYGIRSPTDRQALDRHWQGHIAADQSVANSYGWHYARYEEWAKSRQG